MAKLTDAEFAEYMQRYISVAGTGDRPSPWAQEAAEDMKAAGIINGDGQAITAGRSRSQGRPPPCCS